jgi:hypothetical protein
MGAGALGEGDVLADPWRPMQHGDFAPTALDDEFGDHSEQKLNARLDAVCFDLDMCHRRAFSGCDSLWEVADA